MFKHYPGFLANKGKKREKNKKNPKKKKKTLAKHSDVCYYSIRAAKEAQTKSSLITEQRNTSRLENSLQFRKTEQTKTVM